MKTAEETKPEEIKIVDKTIGSFSYDKYSMTIVFTDGSSLEIGCEGGMGYNEGNAWLNLNFNQTTR